MKQALLLLLLLLFVAGCSQQEAVQENETNETQAETAVEEKEEAVVGPRLGNIAPDFELETLTGDKVKLSDLRGKPVHLVFWSVDCVYCMKELPHVEKLYQQYGEDYHVLALNVTIQDGMKRFSETVEEKGFTFPNLALEEDGGIEVLQNYAVRGIPHNVFVDKDGIIQLVTPGMMDETAQENVIKELIAK